MNSKDEIYMTKDGYEQQLKKLEELQEKFYQNSKDKADAMTSAVGDSWHDNFQFEELDREEVNIVNQIRNLSERIKNIRIIEPHNNENMVNIGDRLKLQIKYADGEVEDLEITLYGMDCDTLNNEITINSPLGKAIYNKKVGDIIVCNINDSNITVNIISKL